MTEGPDDLFEYHIVIFIHADEGVTSQKFSFPTRDLAEKAVAAARKFGVMDDDTIRVLALRLYE